MNQEQIKSLIRHLLTAVGILLTLLGVDKLIPVVEYLQGNLDGLFAAITTVIGIVMTVIGFFKDKDRWQKSEDQV
jgi:hypothetical protein